MELEEARRAIERAADVDGLFNLSFSTSISR
jgi:hypothetical protein